MPPEPTNVIELNCTASVGSVTNEENDGEFGGDVDPFASEIEEDSRESEIGSESSGSSESERCDYEAKEAGDTEDEEDDIEESAGDIMDTESTEAIVDTEDTGDYESADADAGADSAVKVKLFIPMVSADLIELNLRRPSFTIKNVFEALMAAEETAVFDSNGDFIGNVYLNGEKIEGEGFEEEFDLDCEIVMIHNLIKPTEAEAEAEEEDCDEQLLPLTKSGSKSLMSKFKNLWTGKPSVNNETDSSTSITATTHQAGKPKQPSAVFGRPIKDLKRCDSVSLLPEFVSDVLNYLREPTQIQEGLFRLSGNFTKIQEIQEKLDNCNNNSNSNSSGIKSIKLGPADCHNVTSLFKLFLRSLPEPLMTFALYDGWRALGGWTEYPRVAAKIGKFLVKRLPEPNQTVLRELVAFLHLRLSDSEVTRMNACNYGTVIGPNLLWHPQEDRNTRDSTTMGLSLQSSTLASQICTLFLQNYKEIFEDKEEEDKDSTVIFAYAKVLYDYDPEAEAEEDAQSLRENQIVFVTGIEDSFDGWWRGFTLPSKTNDNLVSKFPSNYVQVLQQCPDQELLPHK